MRSELENPTAAPAHKILPTRWQALIFAGRAWALRLNRWLREVNGARPRRFVRRSRSSGLTLLAESRTALYSSDAAAEFALQAGKVHNLRIAARDRWTVSCCRREQRSAFGHTSRGRTRRRGFADGRELREGCVIPSVGGGLCQLSNALYDSALKAGFEIVERHAHSRRVPGSAAAAGRDATLFWNYIDLRFRAPVEVQLDVRLDAQQLLVGFRAPAVLPETVPDRKWFCRCRPARTGGELRGVRRDGVLSQSDGRGAAEGKLRRLAAGFLPTGAGRLDVRTTTATRLAFCSVEQPSLGVWPLPMEDNRLCRRS